jgi:hypothetical protein
MGQKNIYLEILLGWGYMYWLVLKIDSSNDLEFVHEVTEGVTDSSTTKVNKTQVLPKPTIEVPAKVPQVF